MNVKISPTTSSIRSSTSSSTSSNKNRRIASEVESVANKYRDFLQSYGGSSSSSRRAVGVAEEYLNELFDDNAVIVEDEHKKCSFVQYTTGAYTITSSSASRGRPSSCLFALRRTDDVKVDVLDDDTIRVVFTIKADGWDDVTVDRIVTVKDGKIVHSRPIDSIDTYAAGQEKKDEDRIVDLDNKISSICASSRIAKRL